LTDKKKLTGGKTPAPRVIIKGVERGKTPIPKVLPPKPKKK
jgi:hypothetical protein